MSEGEVVTESAPLVSGVSDEDRRLIETFYRAVGGQPVGGQLDLLGEVLAEDWRGIPAPGIEVDADHFLHHLEEIRAVFPDGQVTVHEIIGVQGRIAVRAEMIGTHRREWMGIPATGRVCTIRMHEFHHLTDGRLSRTWPLNDLQGWIQQVRPAPDGTEGMG